jgi:hypothetical protein
MVDVAEGGNQTMVAVEVAVLVGTGVGVNTRGPMGRQALARSVSVMRSKKSTLAA